MHIEKYKLKSQILFFYLRQIRNMHISTENVYWSKHARLGETKIHKHKVHLYYVKHKLIRAYNE